jgi:hypothetical protein
MLAAQRERAAGNQHECIVTLVQGHGLRQHRESGEREYNENLLRTRFYRIARAAATTETTVPGLQDDGAVAPIVSALDSPRLESGQFTTPPSFPLAQLLRRVPALSDIIGARSLKRIITSNRRRNGRQNYRAAFVRGESLRTDEVLPVGWTDRLRMDERADALPPMVVGGTIRHSLASW